MVYKLKDVAIWGEEVKTFYEDPMYIQDGNVNAEVNTFVSSVNSEYFTSDSNFNFNRLKQLITSLYGYVSMKYNLNTTPSSTVPDLSLLNNDLRTLYDYYRYDLPDDYSTLFVEGDSGEVDPVTGEPIMEMIPTQTFLNMEDYVLGAESNSQLRDEERIEQISSEISVAVNDKIIFTLFSSPEIENVSFDSVKYIVDDMKLWELMQDFGWEINGISWNSEWD